MLNKLATKRLLAGLIDITIMVAIDKIIVISGINFTGALIFYYFFSLYQYNTTVGGILLNTKVVDFNNNNLGKGKKALRSAMIAIAFLAIGLTQIASKHLGPLLILLAIALPMFLTKNSVSLIDFFSRSRVVKDVDNTYEKYKKENALIFISAIVVIISFWGYLFVRTQNCYDWFHKKEFRLVTEKCEKVAKISLNPDMYYTIGFSNRFIGQYNKAIELLQKSKLLGKKDIDFVIASVYVDKKDYDKAIEIASRNLNDINMLSVLSMTHAIKASHLKNMDDLMSAYAYSKIIISKSKNLSDIEIQTNKAVIDSAYQFVENVEKSFNPSQKKQANKKFKEVMDKMTNN